MKRYSTLGLAFLTALSPSLRASAATQAAERQDFPAERLRITPNRSGIVDVLWAGVPEHLSWDVGLWTGYAESPLVVYDTRTGARVASFVDDRVGGAFVGSLGLWNFAELSLELPAVFHQGRSMADALVPGTEAPSLQTIGLADLRVMPKVAFLRQEKHHVDLALVAGFTLPTGGASNYFGDAGATFAPELAASMRFGALRFAANGGGVIRKARTVLNQTVESELNLRLGAAWRSGEGGSGPVELGTAISGAVSALQPFENANQNHLEWRAQLAYDVTRSLQLFAGGGVGLAHGWGTPDWRGFAGVRLGQWQDVGPDTDGDGVPDAREARPECITQPEDKDGFEDADGCPDPDNDQDGVLDVNEARAECVNVPEDKDGFEDADGCPDPDNDQDGLADADDKCPLQPEDKDGFEDEDGCPDLDNDKDGVPDDKEARPECVNVPEDRDGFEDSDGCPDPDNDQDGVLDVDEARAECVNVPEDKDGFEDADGCPDPDNDQDGLADADDKCPLQPEDKDGFEDEDGCPDPDDDKDGTLDIHELRAECRLQPGPVENRGCPDADRDGDQVVDRSDNCPDVAGPASNQGCPVTQKQLVAIKKGRLEILDTVYFELAKDVILPKSFPLLDNVAQVINGHPEIAQVRVEGHTDNQGKAAANLDLSDRRAKAVVKYLVGKGVAPERLVAQGFGQTRPIADNKTAPGRAKNRRVEFNVVNPGDVAIQKSDSGPTEETIEKTAPKGAKKEGK